MKIKVMPADVIFCIKPEKRKEPRLSNLIRWFTRAPSEPQTKTSHTAIIGLVSDLIEAKIKVIRTPWKKWATETSDFEVWRYNGDDINQDIRNQIAACAEEYTNSNYGILKLFAHGGDCLISKMIGIKEPYLFRRFILMDRYPICSWIAPHCYEPWGIKLAEVPSNAQDPDCQRDYFLQSHNWKPMMKKKGNQIVYPHNSFDDLFSRNK